MEWEREIVTSRRSKNQTARSSACRMDLDPLAIKSRVEAGRRGCAAKRGPLRHAAARQHPHTHGARRVRGCPQCVSLLWGAREERQTESNPREGDIGCSLVCQVRLPTPGDHLPGSTPARSHHFACTSPLACTCVVSRNFIRRPPVPTHTQPKSERPFLSTVYISLFFSASRRPWFALSRTTRRPPLPSSSI